jgi:hypothetical protein
MPIATAVESEKISQPPDLAGSIQREEINEESIVDSQGTSRDTEEAKGTDDTVRSKSVKTQPNDEQMEAGDSIVGDIAPKGVNPPSVLHSNGKANSKKANLERGPRKDDASSSKRSSSGSSSESSEESTSEESSSEESSSEEESTSGQETSSASTGSSAGIAGSNRKSKDKFLIGSGIPTFESVLKGIEEDAGRYEEDESSFSKPKYGVETEDIWVPLVLDFGTQNVYIHDVRGSNSELSLGRLSVAPSASFENRASPNSSSKVRQKPESRDVEGGHPISQTSEMESKGNWPVPDFTDTVSKSGLKEESPKIKARKGLENPQKSSPSDKVDNITHVDAVGTPPAGAPFGNAASKHLSPREFRDGPSIASLVPKLSKRTQFVMEETRDSSPKGSSSRSSRKSSKRGKKGDDSSASSTAGIVSKSRKKMCQKEPKWLWKNHGVPRQRVPQASRQESRDKGREYSSAPSATSSEGVKIGTSGPDIPEGLSLTGLVPHSTKKELSTKQHG